MEKVEAEFVVRGDSMPRPWRGVSLTQAVDFVRGWWKDSAKPIRAVISLRMTRAGFVLSERDVYTFIQTEAW